MRNNFISRKWNSIGVEARVSISYTICSIFQKCISLITLPLFTRLLTTEQYGQSTVYATWYALIAIFLTLNLQAGSFSTAMVKFEEKRDQYIAALEGLIMLISSGFLLIYLPFKNLWNKLFDLPTYIIVVMVIEIVMSASIQFWSGKKRFEFKYREVIGITVLMSIAIPVVQYIFVINSEEKGYARILGGALVTCVIGVIILVRNILKGKNIFNKEFWKYALGFNIPLLAYYLSQMIFNTSDRIMIDHLCGRSEAAIYGVAYTLAILINFILAAINSSYVPWFYLRLKEGKQVANRRISLAISALVALLLIGVIWFTPEVILILAGKPYYDAIYIVPPVAISVMVLFYAQLAINVEFYFEEKKALVNASILAAILNVALNYYFIQKYGYYAAGYTTLASYVVFATQNYFAMKKVYKKQGIVEQGFDMKKLLLLLGTFVAVAYTGVFLYEHLIIRIATAVVVLSILIVKRNSLIAIWKEMR